jgi:hypothetical protein
MILTAALMHGLGIHLGAWMARDGAASDYVSVSFVKTSAETKNETCPSPKSRMGLK